MLFDVSGECELVSFCECELVSFSYIPFNVYSYESSLYLCISSSDLFSLIFVYTFICTFCRHMYISVYISLYLYIFVYMHILYILLQDVDSSKVLDQVSNIQLVPIRGLDSSSPII